MSDPRPAFVIPEGLTLVSEAGGLSIEYDGDVILSASLGQDLVRVRSRNGDVVLGTNVVAKEISAPRGSVRGDGHLKASAIVARDLVVDGNLEADGVFAQSVRITGDLTAERVTAESGPIRVGGHAIVSDEIVATVGDVTVDGGVRTADPRPPGGSRSVGCATRIHPGRLQRRRARQRDRAHHRVRRRNRTSSSSNVHRVTGDSVRHRAQNGSPRSTPSPSSVLVGADRVRPVPVAGRRHRRDRGRVTVVECHNPLGPTSVKGLLRLQDLSTLIGNPTQFLAERGLAPLGTPQGTASAPSSVAAPLPTPPAVIDDADDGFAPAVSEEPAPPTDTDEPTNRTTRHRWNRCD